MRKGYNTMLMRNFFAFLIFTLGLCDMTDARAQDNPQEPSTTRDFDFATYKPRVVATRINADEAPIVDGKLDDAIWQRAETIKDFYQIEPLDGVRPSQETRAYILYDATTLYVGVYAYDDEPDLISRSRMRRDSRLQDDDAIRLIIDSFGTFRDGFFFGVNPNGARTDALTENNNRFRGEWDTIWRAKAQVVDDGWIVEYAIPFQSISFDASLEDWNFQIIRTVRRNNEEIRWSNIDRSRGRIDITNPGQLAGIEDVKSGIGLEAQLFVTGSSTYDWLTDEIDASFNPSGNIFYKITPSLTGSLTFNTDFSDSPLDSRQVNTGRFSLFFPETRDFFLQDVAVFEFGNELFTRTQNGLPLFTRQIGIVDGVPIDIIAGAKISGQQGPFQIGAISTLTGSSDELGIDSQLLSAARISTPVLDESRAGLVFTNGDPDGSSNNSVAGADFQYRNSTRFNGTLTADFVYLRSFTDGVEDDLYGAAVDYTGDQWGYNLVIRELGENYDPQLGFANRTGIRQYRGFGRRRFRPDSDFLRTVTIGSFFGVITDLNDEVEDRFNGAFIEAQNNIGDNAEFEVTNSFLDIREEFEIADTLLVTVGEYNFTQFEIGARLSSTRRLSVGANVTFGGVFDGDFFGVGGEFSFRPSRRFEIAGSYDYSDFSLSTGSVGIHIASLSNTITFTPDFFIVTDLQYDNISENFTIFSRLIWEPRPEREFFMSFGQSALIDPDDFPGSFAAQSSGLSVRLGNRFRF